MFRKVARVLSGDPQKHELERLSAIAAQINQLEKQFEQFSDAELRLKTTEFRTRLGKGETLTNLLPESFAAVREASKRTLGQRHFNVQLIGGIVMHEGKIAEMRTGEGKTLAATLPLYLNALTGKGAHLVTVNDYLARRDARWMSPIYFMLGLNVGVLQMASRTGNGRNAYLVDFGVTSNHEDQHQLRLVTRKEAYQADITYGTNNEFGFDYLRDNLVLRIENRAQHGHHYAIIDEVDNILIDEARTPLIISGPASEDISWYERMAQVVRQLNTEDYDFSEKDRSVALTEVGEAHVEDLLGIPLRDPDRPEDITHEQARILGYLEQALKAKLLYMRNKDYIIQGGQVIIVDTFTGRLMPGRRWSEGLHQAVEAKEGVKVNPENITHATITLQNYFRKYEKLSGMTGTALTEAEEFFTIYGLEVIPIPTNLDYIAALPDTTLNTLKAKDEEGYTFIYYAYKNNAEQKPVFWKRIDYPDVVYRKEEAKLQAIILEIIRYYVIGRPQLVGTTSIEHSERLSKRLQAESIRRLLQVILIKEAWRKTHDINNIERAIPELEFLNQPLPKLKSPELRQIARQAGLPSPNPDDSENLERIRHSLGLSEENIPRLKKVIRGGIPHQVLNALKHDEESQIIASAGSFGAVTIATNMAGRGVDIKLGGELDEHIYADITLVLKNSGKDPFDMSNTQMEKALKDIHSELYGIYQESVEAFFEFMQNMRQVREKGGLHVIGSERHEARRIDNQLRGRSARQGDPGSSRFYLSLEDELMRLFGGERAEAMMKFFNVDVSLPIESRMIGRMVEQAQERVEGYNFDIRKHLLEYDDVLNDQRERIYTERDKALTKEDLTEDVSEMLHSELQQRILGAMEDPEELWKLLAFLEEIQPTMFYNQQQIAISSFPLRLIINHFPHDFNQKTIDSIPLKTALHNLAEEALKAEKDHLANSTSVFLERTAKIYRQQLQERLEYVNTFFDGIELNPETSSQSNKEFLRELQNYARVKLNLSQEQIGQLIAGSSEAQLALQEQIRNNLLSIFLTRISLTISRRISEPLVVNLSELQKGDWTAINKTYLSAIEEKFNKKIKAIHDDSSQINQNITAVFHQFQDSPINKSNLPILLNAMATGKQMAINPHTHQRGWKRINLLSYIYLTAKYIETTKPETVVEDVLAHFETVQNKLRSVWGWMEWQRMAEAGLTLANLNPSLKSKILSELDNDQILALQDKRLTEIPAAQKDQLKSTFGKNIQNSIFRHILLSAISELWIEHLTRMEALRVSIRMEAYAQRDPLVQYKSQSTDAFKNLLADIRMAVISRIFRVQPIKKKTSAEKLPTPPQPQASQQISPSKKKKKRKRHRKR